MRRDKYIEFNNMYISLRRDDGEYEIIRKISDAEVQGRTEIDTSRSKDNKKEV